MVIRLLPSRFQGVEFNAAGDPVHHVSNPSGVSSKTQSSLVRTITALDRKKNALWANPEVDTRISAYEMAFRMQSSVPGLMDRFGRTSFRP